MTFYSQFGQDKYLENNVFKGFKNGFFVDVGAHNGVSINNTLYFEKNNNWKGINVEPIKKVFDELCANRPTCINLNCAVCNNNGDAEFICNSGYTEMISGLKNDFEPQHQQRLQFENSYYGGATNIITVNTKKLETIFDEYHITRVHYLSIDVEGAEFEVIKSIDFLKVFIDIIDFENNYNNQSDIIINYLIKQGYNLLRRGGDIFMIHKNSPFNL